MTNWSYLFISIAVILDIALNFKAYHSWKFSSVLRLLLKLLVAVAWVVVLPVCYLHSWENPTGVLKLIKDWLRETDKIPSLYISAVIIYLLPNILGAVLFLLPSLRTLVEKSNWKIFQFLLWWSQVRQFYSSSTELPINHQLLSILSVFIVSHEMEQSNMYHFVTCCSGYKLRTFSLGWYKG